MKQSHNAHKQAKPNKPENSLARYFKHHLREWLETGRKIRRQPLQTLMTVFVVGIALSVPTFFLGFINHLTQFGTYLDKESQVSLFLKPNVQDTDLNRLEKTLSMRPEFEKVISVPANHALSQLGQVFQITNLSEALSNNPLPHTLILTVKPQYQTDLQLASLVKNLQTIPEVDTVEIDLEWIKKLNSFMTLAKRFITGITTILAFAVLFVIGNTLRLNIENQKEVIVVSTLIGATDSFVRRPFLYLGFWYGFLGAVLSAVMVTSLNLWIKNPINQLLSLYNTNALFEVFNVNSNFMVLILGVLLGLSSAYFTVANHLKNLRPI